jgi:hypothetical protein
MSERKSRGNTVHVGKRIFALATLAAMALALAGPSWAQSQSAAPKSPRAKQSAPEGQQEGITVHGHWTIDVKNPDGKLVKHVEFENSLDPGFPIEFNSAANGNAVTSIPGGVFLLNSILSGRAAPAPYAWGIMLVGPGSGFPPLQNIQTGSISPCGAVSMLFNKPASIYTSATLDACMLLPPANSDPNLSSAVGLNCPQGGPGISCNVTSTPTPAGGTWNLTGFQLSGTVTATQTGQIGTVATVNYEVCGSLPVSSCPLGYNVTGFPLDLATFTSNANFPGAPISVDAGQTITAAVAISFQ